MTIAEEARHESSRLAARTPALLEVSELDVSFARNERRVQVIDGVTFSLRAGETLAVVGESGSGKSVTALSIMGLLSGGRVEDGSIRFDGRELAGLPDRMMRSTRGREIAMIFQDPLAALDPLFTVGYQLREALRLGGWPKREIRARAVELLANVGIPDAARRQSAYPHELSGGQRQRVVIAMAIACRPKLLIADEPTTALDATVEGQILALIKKIQEETRSALLVITHDMSVVAQIADRVLVMYAGVVVEEGSVKEVLRHPRHPYTRALIDAVPRGIDRSRPVPTIPGSMPDLLEHLPGCRFAPRCPRAMDVCVAEEPPIFQVGTSGSSRCWLEADDSSDEGERS